MKKKLVRNISLVFVILLTLVLFKKVDFSGSFNGYEAYVPEYSPKYFPRPVLFYTALPLDFITANAKYIKANNIAGFIVSSLPSNWSDDLNELKKYQKQAKKINSIFRQNFLRTTISGENLPLWEDEAAWTSINVRIAAVAEFARKTGYKGILLDTKDYNPMLWNPAYAYEQYNSISEELAGKVIYRRARELMASIQKKFPRAVIIVSPAGIFTPSNKDNPYHAYYYWKHFFNGLLSEADQMKIILLSDNLNDFTDQKEFADFIASSNVQVQNSIDYPEKWFKRKSLSFLVWPLGHKNDRYPRYDPDVFLKQMLLTQKYSQNYVVVYDQNLAWWQLENPEKYQIDPEIAREATIKNIEEYFSVIRQLKNPYLQAYFYQLQKKQKLSLVQFYLNSLFAILGL